MRVRFHSVDGSACDRVIVVDPEDSDVHEGDHVGYRCPECGQFDEDEGEIWHLEHCSLAGEGGRRYYAASAPVGEQGPTPELQPEHTVDILRSAVTTSRHDLRNGEAFAFICPVCSTGDETLTETRHDEFCPLSGRHGQRRLQKGRRLATDGGED